MNKFNYLIIFFILISYNSYASLDNNNQIIFESEIYADDFNAKFLELNTKLQTKGYDTIIFKNLNNIDQLCTDLTNCRIVEPDDSMSIDLNKVIQKSVDQHFSEQLLLLNNISGISIDSNQVVLGDYEDIANNIQIGDISSKDINDAFKVALDAIKNLPFQNPTVATIQIDNLLKIRNAPQYNEDENNVLSSGYGQEIGRLFKGQKPTANESIYLFGGESGYNSCNSIEISQNDIRAVESGDYLYFRAKDRTDGGLASDDVVLGKTENRFVSSSKPAIDFKQNFFNNDKTAVDGWEFGNPNRENKKVYYVKAPSGGYSDCATNPLTSVSYFTIDYNRGQPVSLVAQNDINLEINTNLKSPVSSATIDLSSLGTFVEDGSAIYIGHEGPLQVFDQFGNCEFSITDWNEMANQGGLSNIKIKYRHDPAPDINWFYDAYCETDLSDYANPKITIYHSYDFYHPGSAFSDNFGFLITKVDSIMKSHFDFLLEDFVNRSSASIEENGDVNYTDFGNPTTLSGGSFQHLGAIYIGISENNNVATSTGTITLPVEETFIGNGDGFEDNLVTFGYIERLDLLFGELVPDGRDSIYLFGEDQYGTCSPIELAEEDIYIPGGGGYAGQKTFIFRAFDILSSTDDATVPVNIGKSEGRYFGTIAGFNFNQNFYNDDNTRANFWDNSANRTKKIYYFYATKGVTPSCPDVSQVPYIELAYEGGPGPDIVETSLAIDSNLKLNPSPAQSVDLQMSSTETIDDATDYIIIEHRGPFQGLDQWGFCQVDINTWNSLNKTNLTVEYQYANWPLGLNNRGEPESLRWDAYCEINTLDLNNPILTISHNYEYYTYNTNAEWFRSSQFHMLISRVNQNFVDEAEFARNNGSCFNVNGNTVDLIDCNNDGVNDGNLLRTTNIEYNSLKTLTVNINSETTTALQSQDLNLDLNYSSLNIEADIEVALNLDSEIEGPYPAPDIGVLAIDAGFPTNPTTSSFDIPRYVGSDIGYNSQTSINLNTGSDIFNETGVAYIAFYNSSYTLSQGQTCGISNVNTSNGTIIQNDTSSLTKNNLGSTLNIVFTNSVLNTVEDSSNWDPYCLIQPAIAGDNPQVPVLYLTQALPNDSVVSNFTRSLIMVGYDINGNALATQNINLNINRDATKPSLIMNNFNVEEINGQYYFTMQQFDLSLNGVGIYWDSLEVDNSKTEFKQFQKGSISAPRLRTSSGSIEGDYKDFYSMDTIPQDPNGWNFFAFPVNAFQAGETYYWETTDYTTRTHTSNSFSVNNCTINDVTASSLSNGSLSGYNINGNTTSCQFNCNSGYSYNETSGICEAVTTACTQSDVEANIVPQGGDISNSTTYAGNVVAGDVSQCLISGCADNYLVENGGLSCAVQQCKTTDDLAAVEGWNDFSGIDLNNIGGDYVYGCTWTCLAGYDIDNTNTDPNRGCIESAPSNIVFSLANLTGSSTLYTNTYTNVPISITGNGIHEVKLWRGTSSCGGTLIQDWTTNIPSSVNFYNQNGQNIFSVKARNTSLIESECQALVVTHDDVIPIANITNEIDYRNSPPLDPSYLLEWSVTESNFDNSYVYLNNNLVSIRAVQSTSFLFTMEFGTNLMEIEPIDLAGNVGQRVNRSIIYDPIVSNVTKLLPSEDSGEESNLTISVEKLTNSGVKLYSDSNCTNLIASTEEDLFTTKNIQIDLGFNYGLNTIYATQYRGNEESACSSSFASYTLLEPVPVYQNTTQYTSISNVRTTNPYDGVYHATIDGQYIATTNLTSNEVNIYKDNNGTYSLLQTITEDFSELGNYKFDLYMEDDYMGIAKCKNEETTNMNGEVLIYKRNPTTSNYEKIQTIPYSATYENVSWESGHPALNTECFAKIYMKDDSFVISVGSSKGEIRYYKRNTNGLYSELNSNNRMTASWYFTGGIDTAGEFVYAGGASYLGLNGLFIMDGTTVFAKEPDGSLLKYDFATGGNSSVLIDNFTWFGKSLFSLKSDISPNYPSPLCCDTVGLQNTNPYLRYFIHDGNSYSTPFDFDPQTGTPITYTTDLSSNTNIDSSYVPTSYGGYTIFSKKSTVSSDLIYIYYYNPNNKFYELKDSLSGLMPTNDNNFVMRGKFFYLFNKDVNDVNLYIYKIND